MGSEMCIRDRSRPLGPGPVVEASNDACVVMLSPWVRPDQLAGSPCYRLCLNGRWLQQEPICKFGRNPGMLKLSGRFCDENPFEGKTIHGRADYVISIFRRMRGPCQWCRHFLHLCIFFLHCSPRVYLRRLSGILAFKLLHFHGWPHRSRCGLHDNGSGFWIAARPVRQWGPHRMADQRGTTLSWSMVG